MGPTSQKFLRILLKTLTVYQMSTSKYNLTNLVIIIKICRSICRLFYCRLRTIISGLPSENQFGSSLCLNGINVRQPSLMLERASLLFCLFRNRSNVPRDSYQEVGANKAYFQVSFDLVLFGTHIHTTFLGLLNGTFDKKKKRKNLNFLPLLNLWNSKWQ